MSVYFVHCPEIEAVKIGYAEDAWRRFSKIQSDSPAELILLAVEGGGEDREAELHKMFSDFRRHGEWFNFAPPVRQYVAALEPINRKRRKRAPLDGELGRWLSANDIRPEDFASSVGTSSVSIYRFCQGKHIPTCDLMRRIYAATRGAVRPDHFYDLPQLEEVAA